MGELMDRAKAMIDSLPPEGACIVALTNEIARWLRHGILERCGSDFAKRCRVIGIHRRASTAKLIGESRPIVLHHSFIDHAKPEVKAEVVRMVEAINAMHP